MTDIERLRSHAASDDSNHLQQPQRFDHHQYIDRFDSIESNNLSIADDNHYQRNFRRQPSFGARISNALRRSFRTVRRSTSSQQHQASSMKTPSIDIDLIPAIFRSQQQVSTCKLRPGEPFTPYADLLVESPSTTSTQPPSASIQELRALVNSQRINQLKKLIRYNDWSVRHIIRSELWKELCKNSVQDSNIAIYRDQIQRIAASGVKALKTSFLASDGIVVFDHKLLESGAVTLQRLLIVIECVRPEITYVPILYPLTALFLHYMSEEDTFASMLHLLSQGQKYLMQTETASIASNLTLLALIKKHRNSTYQNLRRQTGIDDNDEEMAVVLRDWLGWIFRDLPFNHIVRIVDCYLLEGQKVLYRIAITLVYYWSKQHRKNVTMRLATNSSRQKIDEHLSTISRDISDYVRSIPITNDALLKKAFALRNLSSSHIARLQSSHEQIVQRDMSVKRMASTGNDTMTRTPRHIFTDTCFKSSILSADAVSELLNALPNRLQLETPRLVFHATVDGSSLSHFFNKVDSADQSILVIRATSGEIFGAYCSASWSERRDRVERARTRYFGTGESFVWQLDVISALPIIYRWVGAQCGGDGGSNDYPQMFQTATDQYFVIGSGGGDAIAIRDELVRGSTAASQTFASPALVRAADGLFEIDDLEVFAVPSGCD